MAFGPISFLAPLALAGLIALPVLWWLLRVTPPSPNEVAFPPYRLLLKLAAREEQASRTPLWLLLLRMAIATLIILGAAHPILDRGGGAGGSGPLYLVIDDGWAAAGNWDERKAYWQAVLEDADRETRPVVLATTAPGSLSSPPPQIMARTAIETSRLLNALEPKPWGTDRAQMLERLEPLAETVGQGEVLWISDGFDDGEGIAEQLTDLGPLTVVQAPAQGRARALTPPEAGGADLILRVLAVAPPLDSNAQALEGGPSSVEEGSLEADSGWFVRAMGDGGRVLAREPVIWNPEAGQGIVRFSLPTELRNRLVGFRIEGEASAGAAVLVDERWRRRPVGLYREAASDDDQPLLSSLYYLGRALAPYTDIHIGTIAEILAEQIAVMVLADPGDMTAEDEQAILDFAGKGGVVVRFAGPKLAEDVESARGLLPVELRRGDRALGGAMSWDRPARLSTFPPHSPFFGLDPGEDVTIERQVLARPEIDLPAKTWAALSDGTPLVTAERLDAGWLVLVHTTANTDWSNLAISGLFVEMLRRMILVSEGLAEQADGPPLEPQAALDGFGLLGEPPAAAQAVPSATFASQVVGPETPPGFYGRGEMRRALNLTANLAQPQPLESLPEGTTVSGFSIQAGMDLRGLALGLAFVLLLVDFFASMSMRGLVRTPAMTGVALALMIGLGSVPEAQAQSVHDPAKGGLQPRLAYMVTGDPAVDQISEAGLEGLSEIVRRRTAAALGPVAPVNPEIDELAFYSLIYWPVTPGQRPPSALAADRLNTFMRSGGTILFDTGGSSAAFSGRSDVSRELREIAERLDIPPLVPVPPQHVLGRSFYLLTEFPGRHTGDVLWVQRPGGRINDGVSSVIIGNHDWIGAWALSAERRPMFPVIPGGERQREMAYRFGINLVMYMLTGNYKSDQVHLPEIMRRLDQ
ncbi:MAG: DUF4159 domain-containing protein [Magnetovibrionaceae bacterium]